MLACPSCLHENPDTQKFCGECGARLVDAEGADVWTARAASYTPTHLAREVLTSRFALEGERKLVTVMFCDIANSTPLATRVGAEAMHGLLNTFFDRALAEVHRYEGTINQFLGDGFMALFGAPIAHEDHARRALLAATAIQHEVGKAGALGEVSLRMGLNTGIVVVGKIGDNLRMDYTAIGDTTNLAARLQGKAEPGTICVSEATRRAAEAHFGFRSLGRHDLKGIAEPVHIYQPTGPRAADSGGVTSGATTIGAALVGREWELSRLAQSIDEVRDHRGGILLLRGEPGVGKSRLVTEARRLPEAGDVRWLEGRSLSFGRNLSYLPFIDILKTCFGIDQYDGEAETWLKLEHEAGVLFGPRAAEVVPYLGTVLALEPVGAYEQRIKFLDAQALGRQVFWSMRQLFERLAERGPVLVVMEDWHWVDQSSIALLEHLLPLSAGHAITFWLSTRAAPAAPAARIRAAAQADATLRMDEIALTPLTEEHSRTFIDDLVGADGLPASLRSQILRRTEGNPFFIEEVIRALVSDGVLKRGPRGWVLAKRVVDLTLPDNVQGVIVARVDRLEEGLKSVLKLASVIGRSFFLRILKAIAETADSVEHNLAGLEGAELIRLRQELPEFEYIFKHALVQEAVYGSILVERRKAIHRDVAHAIERLFSDRLDELASLLAYHYALGEEWDKAQEYLFKAGDQAGRMAADAEALEHYRQAEATFLKGAGRELTTLERAGLDRKFGQAYFGVGDYDRAVEHLTRALLRFGIHYPRTRWGVRGKAAIYIAKHFCRRLPGVKAITRGSMSMEWAKEISAVCQSLAWLDYFIDEERFLLDSVIELDAGERSGEVMASSRGVSTLGFVMMAKGLNRFSRKLQGEALAMARVSGVPAALATPQMFRGWLDWNMGRFDDGIRFLDEAKHAFGAIGDLRRRGGATALMAWALLQRGEFARAEEISRDQTRIGEGANDPHITSWAVNTLARLACATGPLDEVIGYSEKARKLSHGATSPRMQSSATGTLAKGLILQGRIAEASQHLLPAIRVMEAKGMRDMLYAEPITGLTMLHLAEAERWMGKDRERALRAASIACTKAYKCSRTSAAGWMAEIQRFHGTLAWLQGDRAAAMGRWQESLATSEALRLPIDLARTRLEIGNRTGDKTRVEEARLFFEAEGIHVDHAFSLHALARMAAVRDGELEAALAHYGLAIAALDKVNATYALGLACRERAQLFSGLGGREEAQADLMRAATCFAAVGADTERAAAEQVARVVVGRPGVGWVVRSKASAQQMLSEGDPTPQPHRPCWGATPPPKAGGGASPPTKPRAPAHPPP
ncbi:MAG: AAA family ATPase, partial [Hyphomicrobium sp.]